MWCHLYSSMCMKMTDSLLICRISPSEWAEPDTDDHTITLSHSLWYLMSSLTLQGISAKLQHIFSLPRRWWINIWWIILLNLGSDFPF